MAKRVVRSSSATRIFSARARAWLIDATLCGWIQRTCISSQMLRPPGIRVNHGRPRRPAAATRRMLRDHRLCTRMSALVRFLKVPIGGAVSSPARFNPPSEDDLREFVDRSLNLMCIAGTDGYFKHVNPAWEA